VRYASSRQDDQARPSQNDNSARLCDDPAAAHGKKGTIVDGSKPRSRSYNRAALINDPSRSQLARAAWLELKLAMFDEKQITGAFTEYDSKVYLAVVGSLRRLYKEIGLERPSPGFASLLKTPDAAA
jgi:hypothetical protein